MLTLTLDGIHTTLSGTDKNDPNITGRILFPRTWKWSRTQNGWVLPRNLTQPLRDLRIRQLIKQADALGYDLRTVDTGAPNTEAARQEDRIARQSARAARYENQAAAEQAASEKYAQQATSMVGDVPFGQPIIVGHYSEKKARNTLTKVHTLWDKAVAADENAAHSASRADSLRREMNASPVTIKKNILSKQRDLRRVERGTLPERHREALEDSLNYYQDVLSELIDRGVTHIYQPSDLKVGDRVRIDDWWGKVTEVLRTNVIVDNQTFTPIYLIDELIARELS